MGDAKEQNGDGIDNERTLLNFSALKVATEKYKIVTVILFVKRMVKLAVFS